MAFVLYGTEACHLCDLAQQVVTSASGRLCVDVFLEDIIHSEQLVAEYGNRIPVLKDELSGRELDWPFTQAELLAWINHKDS